MVRHARKLWRGFIILVAAILSACNFNAPTTPFIAPTSPSLAAVINSPTAPPVTFAPQPTAGFTRATSQTQPPATETPTPSGACNDSLLYVQDITVTDGTIFAPRETIDKRWLVANVGTCNWDTRYRLLLTNGVDLGAAAEQALYPARASTQAIIRIVFTAPAEPSLYRSEWQAYAPDGTIIPVVVFIAMIIPLFEELLKPLAVWLLGWET